SIELTQAGQERANEFREHSIQRRSTHRTLPSLSDLDNHSLLEALKRWGENRKRKHQDSLSEPHSHRSSFRASQTSGDLNSSSHPTTAELAEAAARESNARRCLPAFYTPDDEQLKVRTMVIPIDTNPMERRKIIVACSKDGSLRWKDSDQKTVYERSKDGLVGEEIGEIEFDYLCLPKKSLRKSSSSPLHSNRSNPNTNSSSSSSPTRESSNHRAHPHRPLRRTPAERSGKRSRTSTRPGPTSHAPCEPTTTSNDGTSSGPGTTATPTPACSPGAAATPRAPSWPPTSGPGPTTAPRSPPPPLLLLPQGPRDSRGARPAPSSADSLADLSAGSRDHRSPTCPLSWTTPAPVPRPTRNSTRCRPSPPTPPPSPPSDRSLPPPAQPQPRPRPP
ncbi:hypothetical protein PTTG_28777, partial [Puccinia triticina 1-1 BBBD Race 1]